MDKAQDMEAPLDQNLKPAYLAAMALVERLHRLLLNLVRDEIERRGLQDVNAVQALLLYNINDGALTAGELRARGYYLGSNVSHNVKKLVEMGYLDRAPAVDDRRSVRISLTEKGRAMHGVVAGLYEKHLGVIERIGGLSNEDFSALNRSLSKLERFWGDQIRYRL
jgi:DNA-binding MarR family transcriptional regulator